MARLLVPHRARQSTLVPLALALAAVALVASSAVAESKRERTQQAGALVRQALQAEAMGRCEVRNELVNKALEIDPDNPAARWQAGFVWSTNGKEWKKVDEAAQDWRKDPRVAAYLEKRKDFDNTVAGQFALAQWCAKRGLEEQQRAHLEAILQVDPNNEVVRAQLGFQRVYGVWMTLDDIREARDRTEAEAKNLAEWRPKLLKIAEGLAHRSQLRREKAKEDLAAIDDPAAILGMELLLSPRSEELSHLVLGTLAKMNDTEAALSIARHGVYSPWDSVRDEASLLLRKYPEDVYIQPMLDSLTTPIDTYVDLFRAGRNRLVYRHMFYRESKQFQELAVMDTVYRRIAVPGGSAAATAARALDDARDRFNQRELTVDEQNAITRKLNERICWMLSSTTGANLPPTPESWWRWWNAHNEVYVSESYQKPLQGQYSREDVTLYDQVASFGGGGSGGGSDCLVAGTPIWTSTGPIAVEKLKVGDLVLSQDADSGEVAYKPVVATTVRPKGKLVSMRVGGETITSSGGHLVWVSGEGWTRTRKVKEGQELHGLAGTAVVEAALAGPTEKTYNVVVADFHTYFIGYQRLLSHDNTIRTPTQAVVPGLKAE